jgi:hypothetical protein
LCVTGVEERGPIDAFGKVLDPGAHTRTTAVIYRDTQPCTGRQGMIATYAWFITTTRFRPFAFAEFFLG